MLGKWDVGYFVGVENIRRLPLRWPYWPFLCRRPLRPCCYLTEIACNVV